MYAASPARYSTLPYHRCGKSGLMLPAVSLGLWHNFGDTANFENMRLLCRTAFDNGITHFDLANNYGPEPGSAEKNFGRILKEDLAPYRDELLISTKAGYTMWEGPYGDWGSRKYLLASLDQSLKRMGLEYVDIFYHHRMDPNTPLEETMGALAQAVRSGKALYAGLSNYNGETLEKACAILDELHVPFVINQNRYSIFDRTIEQNGLKETAVRLNRGIIAFSPLAQGLLTNRYLNGIPEDSRIRTDGRFLKESVITEEKLAQIRALNEIAAARSQTLAEMALAWILRDGKVTSVLIGASKPQQILDNIAALNNTTFTADELEAIELRGDDVDQSVVDLYGAGAAGTSGSDVATRNVGASGSNVVQSQGSDKLQESRASQDMLSKLAQAQLTINKCDMLIAKQALRIDELERENESLRGKLKTLAS